MFREECKVVKQVYANGDFFIFGIAPLDYDNTQLKLNKYGSATIKGELGFLTEGKTYTFDLEEGKTDNYGTSYIVKDVPSMQMEDLSNLSYEDKMDILMECTTSERLARNILSVYPDFIELILTQGKEAIDVKKINGVGEAYLNAYSRNLISKYKYYGLCHDSRLKEYELGISEAKALFGMWNTRDDIVNAINRNPYYALIEVCERSYPKADKTILSIRDDLRESKQRTEALIIHILKQNENDGSTRLDGTTLFKIVKYDEDLKAPELAPYLKDVAVESDYIYFDEKSGDLSVMATYLAECAVASFIIEKNKNCEPLDIDIEKYRYTDNGFELSDEQLSVLSNFAKYNFILLVGVSGSGKSFSVNCIVKCCEDLGLKYALMSTTGKASKVLSESTNRFACTAHRKCFTDDAFNEDVFILDEASMCDLSLAYMLFNCISQNPNAKVVLVADHEQLSAVGKSKILTDCLESGIVPKTVLTKVFRYKEDGSKFVATNVRKGVNFLSEFYEPSEEERGLVKYNDKEHSYSVCSNYKFIERLSTEDIFDEIVLQYNKLLSKGIKQKDILIMTPQNVGDIGTYRINNRIQEEINPPSVDNDFIQTRKVRGVEIKFRVNDIVINKHNDYKIPTYEGYLALQESGGVLSEEDIDSTTVLNGQSGRVVKVTDRGLLVKFDQEVVYYSKNRMNMDNLLLGYAITTHSSQGSTCDYSISVVSSQHKRMLSKAMLYVADTRCRKAHIDIGDLDAFAYALTINENLLRKTWLKELLIEYNEKRI